ncbi:MAG TPA: hypothetical protein VK749_21265, partial [Xanthobacteraceae bacterium]|nr:hypothetical protein [Xanthobacteraceae bacterium]
MAERPGQIGGRVDVIPLILAETFARERLRLGANRQHADAVDAQTRERRVHIAQGKGWEFTADHRCNLRRAIVRGERGAGSRARRWAKTAVT